ncbi:MAG: histidine kinase dimerization/phospho-acceptor domain-containing protein, partial [Bdellovibrio sp.]
MSLLFPKHSKSEEDEAQLRNDSGPFRIEASRHKEVLKRRRELLWVIFLLLFLVVLTLFEVRLVSISQQLPFEHSIFFFGLVNFNMVLLLLLLFLIFRNVVKVYIERRHGFFGSSLKTKLVVSFASFTFIPTFLIFLMSVFYINSSFDKWFSVKTSAVLKGALEVTQAYYFNSTQRNYHFAHLIADSIRSGRSSSRMNEFLAKQVREFSLDAVEFYPRISQRVLQMADREALPEIPRPSVEFLRKALIERVEASTIQTFAEGNLVRVVVPVEKSGALVVSSFLPLSLTSKVEDISQVYNEFRESNPLEYPLRSIHLTILAMVTFVILLAATWFGFHLARQLSIPLVQLGRATRRVAGGDYTPVQIDSGSEEITSLVDSFNQMTVTLAQSERDVRQANENLKQTLSDLDRHNRYIEVVLGNVSAGVISVDPRGRLATINKRAGALLKIHPADFIGRPIRDLLTQEYFRTFSELYKSMEQHRIERIQKEFSIHIQGDIVPVQMTLSLMRDQNGLNLGTLVVFDDMSPIVNAQRAQAWTEVARRIAHEIKNPLTPIRLSAERLQRKFGSDVRDPAFGECTSMIIRQTEELKNLVNEFTQFARLPELKPVLADLNETMDSAVQVFAASHAQVQFVVRKDPRLPPFYFDPGQIYRVLVNLIDNSVQALQGQKEAR